jgi:PAS domain S-box-containing protein
VWIEQLVSQTNDFAFIELSLQGVITDWYGASELVLGFTRDEAVGQSFAIIFTADDVCSGMPAQELSVALAQGRSEDDRWHRRKDDSRFWGSGVVQPIRGDDGELIGFCKVLRNRTDLRSQIAALENRALLEDKLEAERRSTLAIIAHELRNPLGAITSAGHLLERADDDAAKARASAILSRQMGVLRRLVDDLSGLSQAQVSGRLLSITSFEVQPVLRAALAGFIAEAANKGQTLNLVLPEGPITIEADEERFEQMLMNLVANALKYAPGGNVTVSASVEGKSLAVRVDDDGVGIAPEALQNIFELFTREVQGKEAPEGLGVGLAVVKELARAHGGGIEARSPGKGLGSVFTLRLPLAASAFLKDPEHDDSPDMT